MSYTKKTFHSKHDGELRHTKKGRRFTNSRENTSHENRVVFTSNISTFWKYQSAAGDPNEKSAASSLNTISVSVMAGIIK